MLQAAVKAALNHQSACEVLKHLCGTSIQTAVISSLGLYGLMTLIAMHRTKEMGVRKILGASLRQLLILLASDSIKLILLASCIGLPLALYGSQQWLQSYAYRIDIAWWMFILPVFTNIFIALLVIAKQVIQVAVVNPVKSLRTE